VRLSPAAGSPRGGDTLRAQTLGAYLFLVKMCLQRADSCAIFTLQPELYQLSLGRAVFAKISRAQLLAVTGWSTTDLDNRAHANQLALAHGLTLPASNGAYIGVDCFALLLSDALVEAGFTRALAARFVRESHEQWLHGLERVEWPQMHPPPVPFEWAPTKRAIDEGVTVPPPDAEIYFAVAKNPNGDFQAVNGTLLDIVGELARGPMSRAAPAGAPTHITNVNLRHIKEVTLAAAAKAGVDLGAPFTRPDGHPQHREWYAAVAVHRALSLARLKGRKPPGPARAKARAKGQRAARAPASKRLVTTSKAMA